MTSSKNTNVTPADVAAKAAEEKLVTVPEQNDGESEKGPKTKVVNSAGETIAESVDGKKTLKNRVADKIMGLVSAAGRNKKVVIAVGAAVGVSTVAFVKYAKAKAELTTVEELSDDENTADEPAV